MEKAIAFVIFDIREARKLKLMRPHWYIFVTYVKISILLDNYYITLRTTQLLYYLYILI